MKTKDRVTLYAEQEVEIDVEHGPDQDPPGLSQDEERAAIAKGSSFPTWTVGASLRDVRKF